MCKKLLVLTKSCWSRTDRPALVSNTGYIIDTWEHLVSQTHWDTFLFMINQQWSRQWLGAYWHQDITGANVDPGLWCKDQITTNLNYPPETMGATCTDSKWNQYSHRQRVLMHGHQGWNVRHGLCHIYMIYVYIWVVYSFCLFCCLFIIVTTQFVALYKPCKPKPKTSTYDPPPPPPPPPGQPPPGRDPKTDT